MSSIKKRLKKFVDVHRTEAAKLRSHEGYVIQTEMVKLIREENARAFDYLCDVLEVEFELKKESVNEEIQSIDESFPIGTPIKYKNRTFGVVTEIRCNLVYFVYHNGMKPCHNFATVDQLEKINLKRFKEYIQCSGTTSLLKYLK